MTITKATLGQIDLSEILDCAVLYLRVSSKKQMDTAIDIDPDGNSIATQREITTRKASTLPARVVKEFIEPGVSASSLENRPAFQEMIKYLQEHREVKYVIVYARSRAFRNYIDAGITTRLLDKLGVKLISTREDFGDGIQAEMMSAITDVFNYGQNKLSGQDISIKLQHKAVNGGTISRTRLGYENVRVLIEGRNVNTVRFDEKRAQLIKQGFELYATGDYTSRDLEAIMADRGLTTRATPRHPVEKPVSDSVWLNILRDPYYIGYVTYKGDIYPGRHEPLIEPELFEKVQEVLDFRSAKGNRDRVDQHYLKGMLFCARCRDKGRTARLIYNEATSHTGTKYGYFVCRAQKEGLCDMPHIRVERVEHAVAGRYHALRLPTDFIATVQTQLDDVIQDEQGSVKELHASLHRKLKKLEEQENNLIDLAADALLPQAKIRAKLHQIHVERNRVQTGLANTTEELEAGAAVLRDALSLVADPQRAYQHAPDTARRQLNQTFYQRFYINRHDVVDDEKASLFAELHDAHSAYLNATAAALVGDLEGRNGQSEEDGLDGLCNDESLPMREAHTCIQTNRPVLSDLFVQPVGGWTKGLLVVLAGFE